MTSFNYNYRGYRYGFNGKENDNEVKGGGNALEFGGRSIYDARLGRFISIDPRWREFSYMSPFCFAANNPIFFIDENGEGPLGFDVLFKGSINASKPFFQLMNWFEEKHEQGKMFVEIAKQSGQNKYTQYRVYVGAFLYGGANQHLPGFSTNEDLKSLKSSFNSGNILATAFYALLLIDQTELLNGLKLLKGADRLGGDIMYGLCK